MVKNLDFDKARGSVSFFETVIRILGGLASAADLSGDPALAAKAADLAQRLAPAFLAAPTGGWVGWGGGGAGAAASRARQPSPARPPRAPRTQSPTRHSTPAQA